MAEKNEPSEHTTVKGEKKRAVYYSDGKWEVDK